jgi:hypothetical protein
MRLSRDPILTFEKDRPKRKNHKFKNTVQHAFFVYAVQTSRFLPRDAP